MIKKIICVLLAAVLILAAAACGKNTPEDKGQPGSQTEKEASSAAEKTKEENTEVKSTEAESTKENSTEAKNKEEDSTEAKSTETESTEDKSTEKESTDKENTGGQELHITDGLLLKYLADRKVVHLVVHKDQEAGNSGLAAYRVFELTGLTKEMEEQLAPMLSGTHVQMIYTMDEEGLDPLPVVPGEILDLDADSE